MIDERDNGAAVYAAFTTFKNVIEGLVGTVPNTIDRTAFQGQSWAVQSQLLTAFKFLGLIDGDGKPTAALHSITVPDEQARKKALETVLRHRYADLFNLDLTKTTLGALTEQMAQSYNVTGDTREKAVRFFLAAVEYLGIPVSKFLRPAAGGSGGGTKKRRSASAARAKSTAPDDDEDDDEEPPTAAASGTTKTVTLKGAGGTVTLSTNVDLFNLEDDDRTFVLEMIDRMKKYGQGKA